MDLEQLLAPQRVAVRVCCSDSGDVDLVAAGLVGAEAFGRGGISSWSVILLVFVPLTKEVCGAGLV